LKSVQGKVNGRELITIVKMSLRFRWAKNVLVQNNTNTSRLISRKGLYNLEFIYCWEIEKKL